MSIEDIQLIRGVGFLKELSIFSQLEEQSLKAIWPICSCQKYERGQIVYQEGQIATYIYLIKEGEVSISRLLENDTKDSQKTQNLPERIVKKNLIWQSEIAQKKKEKVFIAKLGENQYFGELELLTSNINLRYTRATCESKTTLYSISKKQLIAILGQNGLSSQISEIFQLRTTIYDEQTQKVIDGRNKRRKIKKHEEQIEAKDVLLEMLVYLRAYAKIIKQSKGFLRAVILAKLEYSSNLVRRIGQQRT